MLRLDAVYIIMARSPNCAAVEEQSEYSLQWQISSLCIS